MKKYTFEAKEIFQEIPDDPENVIMTIPEEIRNELGWKEGDSINIKAEDGQIILTKNG